MRSLEKALSDHELIVLRVLGEWWEQDFTGFDRKACVKALTAILSKLDMVQELNYLAAKEAEALQDLIAQEGKVPVASFSRNYGEVREMGPGRLEREEPWLAPENPAEALWYRGFLYRGFDDTPEGMIEFYYVPDELYEQFPQEVIEKAVIKETTVTPLPPASPPKSYQSAPIDAVDDMAAILSEAMITGLPEGQVWQQTLLHDDPDRLSFLRGLARETGILQVTEYGIRPTRTAVAWLRHSREEQLRSLMETWSSSVWNELRHTPGLQCEGETWQNDPILARTTLLDALPRSGEWFHLDELVAHIKETDPDFQRPDGNYDTWYIRDLASGDYITGFAQWDKVEGRLLRFLVQGPMFWLGMVELSEPALFRLTPRTLDWLNDTPAPQNEVNIPIVVQPDCTLLVPFNAGRYERFQTARISEALPSEAGQPFQYRLTPASLNLAREQSIDPARILVFLQDASGRPLPPGVKRAIERWTERGVEGRLETAVVLRVRDKEILDTLRQNPKTRDYLGESLGDLAVVVRDREKLLSATAQLGLLLDSDNGLIG